MNNMTPLTAGMDIGGTNSVIGLVNRKGYILKETRIKTTDYPEFIDFANKVKRVITKLMSQIDGQVALKGIGIGAPDGNYYTGTISHAPNLPWQGTVPINEVFEKILKVPAFLTNDANAAAIGELLFGKGKKKKHFIVITLGTGLGSGIVVDGDVLYGHTGVAGELGHITVDPDGRECSCGRKGCLESYVSATGLCRTFSELLGVHTSDSDLRSRAYNKLSSAVIFEAAQKGDAIALEAFDITAKRLALALSNAVVVLNPEAIFLFGGLAKAGGLILKPTRKYFKNYLWKLFEGSVTISLSGLQDTNAAVLGSSALAWKELEKNGSL